MVHQDYRLLTDRSVAENVALPLIIAGMNPKEATIHAHWFAFRSCGLT